jgi:hypothetical protein
MLQPNEKKIITGIAIAGALGGIAYLILQNRNAGTGAGNAPETPQTPQVPQTPQAPQAPQQSAPPEIVLPMSQQYNENINLCYKNGYTKMNKTLQSLINEISRRNGYTLIDVDGVFGLDTLKRVRAYFGGAECVTLKKAFDIKNKKQVYNNAYLDKLLNPNTYLINK